MFFMLRGRIYFQVDGTTIEARTGDSVVVPEGGLHDFENPSPDRFYLLTIVSSDHGFADSLRHGIPTPLDAEDLALLRSL
jgi:quercetin dioxygenase-like cupin family protein